MTTTGPFALRLFVPSGLPEGMRIVEKSNWSGIGYVIPRSQLKEFTERPEASRPGVYVITGPDPEDGGTDLATIGEADPLGRRLEQHQAKDFWTTAYAFTSKDGYLNKAQAQHLEARLIGLAQAAKRCRLENVVQGHAVNLAEMDRRGRRQGLRVTGRVHRFQGGQRAPGLHRQLSRCPDSHAGATHPAGRPCQAGQPGGTAPGL